MKVVRIRRSINIKYNLVSELKLAIPEYHMLQLEEHAEHHIFAMIEQGHREGKLLTSIRDSDDQEIEYSGYWEAYREGTLSCSTKENEMSHEDALKSRVHELFHQVSDRLDPQIDKVINSGCRMINDPAMHDELAKAIIIAFLQDEVNRHNLLKAADE